MMCVAYIDIITVSPALIDLDCCGGSSVIRQTLTAVHMFYGREGVPTYQ